MNFRTSGFTIVFLPVLLAAFTSSAPAAAPAHTPVPCALLTQDQLKAVLGSPVQPGQPGDHDCTWNDSKGATRIYLSVKDATDYKTFHDSMQATGKLIPVTGIAEDAFFIGSSGNSAALYTLKARRLLLITVDGIGFTRAQNEAAEKALAVETLPKL